MADAPGPTCGSRAMRRAKNGGACGTAKFREETSKKADSAARGRIAAVHNVGDRIVRLQAIFAVQHSRKLDMEATPLVAIPLTQPASLGNDVRTPPPRRGVVVLVVGVRSAGRLRRAEDSCPAERNSRLHCPPHPADAVIDIAPCPNTRHRSVQRHPRLPEQRVGFPLQRADHRPDTVPGYQPAPRAGLPHAGCGRSLAGTGPPPCVRIRRTRPGRCGRAGEEASARVILVTSAEPGQSSGRHLASYAKRRWPSVDHRYPGRLVLSGAAHPAADRHRAGDHHMRR
jgi:hypothetical protein